MKDEFDILLVERYPELYRDRFAPMTQTLMCWGFECGDGWYQIIDTLSYALVSPHREAKKDLEFWTKNLGKEVWRNRTGTQEDIDRAQKKLDETPCPVAVQVKEKFGTLRFYVDKASNTQYNYIDFADLMSSRTCEECGKPGETYPIGWYQTLCEQHADERYGESAMEYRLKTGEWAEEDK